MLNELYEKHDEQVAKLKQTAIPQETGRDSDTDNLTDGETAKKRKYAI
jgi:hypothetical protein